MQRGILSETNYSRTTLHRYFSKIKTTQVVLLQHIASTQVYVEAAKKKTTQKLKKKTTQKKVGALHPAANELLWFSQKKTLILAQFFYRKRACSECSH